MVSLMGYEVIVGAKTVIQKVTGIEGEPSTVTRKYLCIKDINLTPVNTIINLKAQVAHLGKVIKKTSQSGNDYQSQVVILSDGAHNKV